MQKALNGTNNGKGYNHISTSYPSLAVASTENLGQWSFGGTMAGWAALSVTKYICIVAGSLDQGNKYVLSG